MKTNEGGAKKRGKREQDRKPFMAKDFRERPNTEGTEVGQIECSEEKTRGQRR